MPTVAIPESIQQVSAETLRVTGVITDSQTFKQPFTVDLSGSVTQEEARAKIASLVSSFQSTTALKSALVVGQPFDLTPPAVVTPVVVDDGSAAFGAAYAAYQSGQRKVALGLLAANDPDVAGLLKAAQAAYKPTFVGMF